MLDESTYRRIKKEYGFPAYIFDSDRFCENYRRLTEGMGAAYAPYRAAYSYKTNYTPRIVSLVRSLGGMAEVVSGMEYALARRVGNAPENILFNGPCKGEDGIAALLDGACVIIDNAEELAAVLRAASAHPECVCHTALRLHVDIGSGKPSRFGLCAEPEYLKTLAARLRAAGNISFDGIQCHISGSRSIAGWESRARVMLALARELFPDAPPKFIDLGSGMFGRLPEEMRASFAQSIPTFAEYGAAVGTLFRAQYGALPISERPALITEPGTTLVADTMQFAAPVTAIKSLPGNDCAVLDASIHTAGVISQMRNLPLLVLDAKTPRENLNFTGYTCLEYDILYRGYTGPLDVGSSVIFDNIGSYSNVLKPPFIHPDVPMIEYRKGDDSLRLIKRAQTAEEIFAQYVFEE